MTDVYVLFPLCATVFYVCTAEHYACLRSRTFLYNIVGVPIDPALVAYWPRIDPLIITSMNVVVRKLTDVYVMQRSITFMDFRWRKWIFFKTLKNIVWAAECPRKGPRSSTLCCVCLRSPTFRPRFSTYVCVITHATPASKRKSTLACFPPVFRQ